MRTFECLVRAYDVKRYAGEEEAKPGKAKKRQRSIEPETDGRIITKPYPEMKGHTGYLTFARLMSRILDTAKGA